MTMTSNNCAWWGFDRVTVDGVVHSLAVEDGCQVLDRPPADKYTVGTDQTFAALSAVCDAQSLAAATLIRYLAFAYITGNGDAHAKNFSVLKELGGEWRVTPVYDTPSSQLYGDTTMAMSIGGRHGGDFGAADFIRLGAGLNVPERAVRRLLVEVVERADLWIDDLPDLPFDKRKLTKLRRVIDYRRRRVTGF